MRISDWSSDVCSSDLHPRFALTPIQRRDGKTVGLHRHHHASPMSKLESLSGRALELAGSVGDTLTDRVPARATKWIETGAPLGEGTSGRLGEIGRSYWGERGYLYGCNKGVVGII